MRRLAPWLITLLTLLGLAAALFFDWRRVRQISDCQRQIELATPLRATQVRDLRARIESANGDRIAAEHAGAETKAALPPPPGPRTGLNFGDMRKDPEYAALWHRQQLRNIQRQYAEIFAKMNLAPAELAKLKDLLVAREDARRDALDAGAAAGLTGRDLTLANTRAAAVVNNEIKDLIGAADFSLVRLSPQTDAYKSMIENGVGVDLNLAGSPLSPAQESALAATYIQNIRQAPGGGAGPPGWQVPNLETGLAPADQAALAQAAGYLTPSQVVVVKESLIEQRQVQQFMKRMPAAVGAGGG
jgi:hypothetical protein